MSLTRSTVAAKRPHGRLTGHQLPCSSERLRTTKRIGCEMIVSRCHSTHHRFAGGHPLDIVSIAGPNLHSSSPCRSIHSRDSLVDEALTSITEGIPSMISTFSAHVAAKIPSGVCKPAGYDPPGFAEVGTMPHDARSLRHNQLDGALKKNLNRAYCKKDMGKTQKVEHRGHEQ